MTDAVITRLSAMGNLVVRPTSSVLRYADPKSDPSSAGRDLGVEALLDGKVQKYGDKIRVSVQLVRVKDSRPLWGESFDENFTNIFEIEDSISKRVVESLAVRLAAQDRQRLSRHYTENVQAFQDYLRGRYSEFTFTPDGLNKAIAYFNRAIELDPNYALAYAGLADAYTTASDWVLPPRVAMPRAEAAARKALAIDDHLAEAYAALGHALMHQWDLPAAEKEFKRALALNPNNTAFYFTYAEFLSGAERLDESTAVLKRALLIDPYSPEILSMSGWPIYLKGDYDGAIAAWDHAVQIVPDLWQPHFALGEAYLAKKLYPQAIAELQKARELNPYATNILAALAEAFVASGKRPQAEAILAQLQKMSSQQYVSPMDVASVYNSLGNKAQALDWLDKAYLDNSEMLLWLNQLPNFTNLRSNPRFQEITRKVNQHST